MGQRSPLVPDPADRRVERRQKWIRRHSHLVRTAQGRQGHRTTTRSFKMNRFSEEDFSKLFDLVTTRGSDLVADRARHFAEAKSILRELTPERLCGLLNRIALVDVGALTTFNYICRFLHDPAFVVDVSNADSFVMAFCEAMAAAEPNFFNLQRSQ